MESYDDIWRSMPRCIKENGKLFWITVTGNIGGVSACYQSGDGEIHDIKRIIFIMSRPANKEDDEPTKALSMLRKKYKAWLPNG